MKRRQTKGSKSDYREIEMKVRLTKEEAAAVKKKAFEAGLQPAVYLRQVGTGKELKAAVTVEQMAAIAKVTGMANNLNQVVKLCHKNGLVESAKEIDSVIEKLNKILCQ